MAEVQNYQRKKTVLVILFMFLLVVFVCLMCFIFLHAKLHPLPKFISPDEIEIKEVTAHDYTNTEAPSYAIVSEPNLFNVQENDLELKLTINENNKIEIIRNEIGEEIQIMLNDTNINENVKAIYQNKSNSLILMENGTLYEIVDNLVVDNKLNVEQILTNMNIKEIVILPLISSGSYVLDSNNKVINVATQEEYMGIIEQINTATSTIYVYENYGFGLEKGKFFVDENNQVIKINLSFDNKIIGENNIVYEIDSSNNTLLTSKIGEFREVGYNKKDGSEIYTITVLSNTGNHELSSNYYYTR